MRMFARLNVAPVDDAFQVRAVQGFGDTGDQFGRSRVGLAACGLALVARGRSPR